MARRAAKVVQRCRKLVVQLRVQIDTGQVGKLHSPPRCIDYTGTEGLMVATKGQSIVEVRNFVIATRDTGYRSTAAAVAELVDNAVQAGATRIQIFVQETHGSGGKQVSLAVLVNGRGMEPALLRTALQFGGSGRFNERSGLGRFGMGLPNSTVSQCRHAEVYSWQKPEAVYRSMLDVDDIAAGKMTAVPVPTLTSLPKWMSDRAEGTGTLIIWTKCDRLDNRRAGTIARKLHAPLGRRFRYYLWQGTEIYVNDELVAAIDPLFCHPLARVYGASEFCEPLEYPMRLPNGALGSSTIRVRFSLLPVDKWYNWSAEEKRSTGISGGAGVSIVRAGREIAYGWYFMGRRRRQNYDDWWRCEVAFDPELDEWFGVTHSKQDINPMPELESVLSFDIIAMANRLNNTVRDGFVRARTCDVSTAAQKASVTEWILPTVQQIGHTSSPAQESEHFSARLSYNIRVEARTEPDFVIWKIENSALQLTINENHPFFVKVYRPLRQSGNSDALFHLECMLLAYARSEATHANQNQGVWAAQLRQDWSNTLAALLS
jgi:hypothetical protein